MVIPMCWNWKQGDMVLVAVVWLLASVGMPGCGARPVCAPDCTERECGTDPVCGASCGTCAIGECDSNGKCVCKDVGPIFVDAEASTGDYSSIGIDSSDKVHISYYNSDKKDLKYATNTSGSWQTSTIDSRDGQVRDGCPMFKRSLAEGGKRLQDVRDGSG
jgi:hypothetical protein